MALVTRKIFFQQFNPLIQAKRFRGKINIQRPKPVHFERAVYMQLTKPYFPSLKKEKKPVELCGKASENVKEEADNPFQYIIAKELTNWFNNSRLIAFFHMNPMKSDQQFKAFVMFKKEKMHLKSYGKKTLELAVKDTNFEPVLDFYVSKNVTVFSPEPEIKKLLKITKKFPQLVLLAAIFEGKFISKDEIIQLSQIHDIRSAQASLVQTLNSAGALLAQQLTSHQTTLVAHLEERVKQLQLNDK